MATAEMPVTFRVEMMARSLMRQHGLITDNRRTDWQFRYDHARKRAGLCTFPHNGRPGVISISEPMAATWDEAEIRDTILHEIAHALVGKPGHGEDWRAMCRRVGARPEARFSEDESRPMPAMKYTGTCERGHKFQRRVLPPGPVRCRKDKTRITWTEN